uniref:SCP2 domain-containing protein n=1 Tax=Clytia hemisphaerica TaxID=252671 RepID=A0A7M5US17_9CNID
MTDSSHCIENSFQSDVVFKEIERRLKEEKATLIKKFKAIFSFELAGADGKKGVWFVDAKKDGVVLRGQPGLKADCTIKMKDEDCFKMMIGQINPQTSFMQGKIKISGNMALAMKLQQLKVTNLKSKM